MQEQFNAKEVETAVNGALTKEQAITRIKEIAKSKGYSSFKVLYDGVMIGKPSDLPDVVVMEKVEIMPRYNQA